MSSDENVKQPQINDDNEYKIHCSFCEKSHGEVRVIIAGPQPRPAFICAECVDVCLEIFADYAKKQAPTPSTVSEGERAGPEAEDEPE